MKIYLWYATRTVSLFSEPLLFLHRIYITEIFVYAPFEAVLPCRIVFRRIYIVNIYIYIYLRPLREKCKFGGIKEQQKPATRKNSETKPTRSRRLLTEMSYMKMTSRQFGRWKQVLTRAATS